METLGDRVGRVAPVEAMAPGRARKCPRDWTATPGPTQHAAFATRARGLAFAEHGGYLFLQAAHHLRVGSRSVQRRDGGRADAGDGHAGVPLAQGSDQRGGRLSQQSHRHRHRPRPKRRARPSRHRRADCDGGRQRDSGGGTERAFHARSCETAHGSAGPGVPRLAHGDCDLLRRDRWYVGDVQPIAQQQLQGVLAGLQIDHRLGLALAEVPVMMA